MAYLASVYALICARVKKCLMDKLEIGMMVENNTDYKNTAFTESIDYSIGTTTGISAADRVKTDQMNQVIKYFQNLGYTIERLKNTTTNKNLKWVISY